MKSMEFEIGRQLEFGCLGLNHTSGRADARQQQSEAHWWFAQMHRVIEGAPMPERRSAGKGGTLLPGRNRAMVKSLLLCC